MLKKCQSARSLTRQRVLALAIDVCSNARHTHIYIYIYTNERALYAARLTWHAIIKVVTTIRATTTRRRCWLKVLWFPYANLATITALRVKRCWWYFYFLLQITVLDVLLIFFQHWPPIHWRFRVLLVISVRVA